MPGDNDWFYEIKLDGYRALGIRHGGAARLVSRNEKSLAAIFSARRVRVAGIHCEKRHARRRDRCTQCRRRTSFQLLQSHKSTASAIVYYAFDLLTFEGEDWPRRPLDERKAKLTAIVVGSQVRHSGSFTGLAEKTVAAVEQMKLEGVIAKRRDSVYQTGERSGV